MGEKHLTGMLSVDELRDLVTRGEIDTVLTVFPDLYGRLVGKRVHGRYFIDEVLDHGMHACNYLLACDMDMNPVPGYDFASWQKGYGDFLCTPDFSTLRRAAWQDRTALVICDVYSEDGSALVPVAPRSILKRQLERARGAGIVARGASELEFFLLDETYESALAKGYDDLRHAGWYVEDYHTLSAFKNENVLGDIRRLVSQSGIPVESSKGEWGPGQQEINLRYCGFLEMADRHAIYKQAAKEIAIRHGKAISFMAKMDDRHAGSSMHVHSSLWSADRDAPLFAGKPDADGVDRELPLACRWWLGGLLKHARASTLLFAPYVNSYKRFCAGSFAPTAVAWAHDNRTAGFRVVGRASSRRVECRIPGADANPYLVFAAVLAAGMDGLSTRNEAPSAMRGDAYSQHNLPTIPAGVDEAVREFEKSAMLRSAFGGDVVDHLCHFARVEKSAFDTAVTTWERRRYFERA